MAKTAYDRVKNANERSEMYVKTPVWDNETESSYMKWQAQPGLKDLAGALKGLIEDGFAVSFKPVEGSICVTLTDLDRRVKEQTCLLTGWSDNTDDALKVALYKHEVMLKRDWESLAGKVPLRIRR